MSMDPDLHQTILDHINGGALVIDREYRICYWNRFMSLHSGSDSNQVIGKDLFEVFPELPCAAIKRKLRGVFMLGTPSFSGWEQRHHLFNLNHSRPITTDSEFMAQNCSFLPLKKDGEVEKVCIIIEDTTDVSFYQTRLNEALVKMERLNRIDGLTGVANRRFWEERLIVEFSRSCRHNRPLSLLMFDLDKFKSVNDRFGHQAGDQVLVTTAELVQSLLRKEDLFGRYGGEEFAVILPDTPEDQAAVVAERIRRTVAGHPYLLGGQPLPVTISVGAATHSDEVNHEKLISRADTALYQAKTRGRNQVAKWQPELA